MPKRKLESAYFSNGKIVHLDTSKIVSIQIISKSGIERYSFPENLSGHVDLDFNMGGLAGVYGKEKLK